MERRVVVTGVGLITPLGIGKDDNWNSLIKTKRAFGPITLFDTTNLPTKVASEVKDFDIGKFIKDRKIKRLTFRSTQLAIAAAKLAIEDSGLPLNEIDPCRFGAMIGSGGGGFDDGPGFEDLKEAMKMSWDEKTKRFHTRLFGDQALKSVYPLFLLKTLPNNAFFYITTQYNIQGDNNNIISSFAGGLQAIGDGFRSIKTGCADIMIAGGYDSLILPQNNFSFFHLGLTTKHKGPDNISPPFDLLRDGFVLGEGAAMLIMEELSFAEKRGARIYGELLGYGCSCDAFHIYEPDPNGKGIIAAAKRALEDAKMRPDEIDYINAEGMGTKVSDWAETKAIKGIFGDKAYKIPISATKSMTGHMGTASGPAEVIFSLLAIQNEIIPPTAYLKHPDPQCDLDFVPLEPRQAKINNVMSITQGFGGQNAILIISKYPK